MATIEQQTKLVHFVFIYTMAVTPGYKSLRLTPSQIEELKSLRGDAQRDKIITLCDKSHVADKIRHIDWMVSTF
ncbi:MAG: hypothetical protein NC453_13200 [Muribaculum sp.]|nr:hypothetical protein [Muribaculum sp.]